MTERDEERDDIPPTICVVGASGSGKTRLLEGVLPKLRAAGLRVGVLKHTHHAVPFDKKGKDSWRHAQAGAEQVILFASSGIAYFDYRPPTQDPIDAIARHFSDLDLVLIEGCKWADLPKIEVYRRVVSEAPFCLEDARLLAIVTDDPVSTSVPRLSPSDLDAVAALLLRFVGHETT